MLSTQSNKPRVVVIAPYDLHSAADVSKNLTQFGISTFHAGRDIRPGEVWMDRIRDEIKRADAAVVFSKQSNQSEWLDLEYSLLKDRLSEDPAFVVIPVVRNNDELSQLPKEIRSFQVLAMPGGEFTQDLPQKLAESIFLSLPSTWAHNEAEDTLAEVIAEAEIALSRLEFIQASHSQGQLRYENIIFITMTGVGVFLSVVAFLSRAAWFEYLVIVGGILVTSGPVLALFAAMRLRRQRKIETRASMLSSRIESVLGRAIRVQSELDRAKRVQSETTLQVDSV